MTQPTRSLVVPTTMGRLHVQDSGPVGGTVALLWPSLFTDGLTSWGAQLSGLHDLGWRTLLIDPPGTGGSPPRHNCSPWRSARRRPSTHSPSRRLRVRPSLGRPPADLSHCASLSLHH